MNELKGPWRDETQKIFPREVRAEKTGAQGQSWGGEAAKAKFPSFPVSLGKAGSQDPAVGWGGVCVFVQN